MSDPDAVKNKGQVDRRWMLWAGVGAAATLGGFGTGVWRGDAAGDASLQPLPDVRWQQRFATPQGGELALADWRGRAMLLNFWASWCAPCVREMPLLDRWQRRAQAASAGGAPVLDVIGLAIDQKANVLRFLGEHPVSFPIALAGTAGMAWMQELGNSAGGLPFSVLIDRRGRLAGRRLGELDEVTLGHWWQLAAT